MNIIYVVHQTHLNERSGVPLIAKQYADNAIKANHNVAIISPHKGYVDSNLNEFKKDNISFYSWPSLDNWYQNAFNFSIKTEEMKKYKMNFKPDIIHILDWVGIRPDFLNFLNDFKVPILKHVLNLEDICLFDSSSPFDPEDSLINNHYHNERKISGKIARFFWFNLKYDIKNYYEKLEARKKSIMHINRTYFDHLIFPTSSFAKFYLSHLNLKTKFDVLGLGVVKNELSLNKKNNDRKRLNFIFIGGGSQRKGWDIIEKSFYEFLIKNNDKINLRIYGFKKKTSKSCLNKFKSVEFFDSFDPSNLNSILNWADFGLTTSYFEGYCKVLYEYIEAKVIPITTNFFGSEIIKNDYNGIVIGKPYHNNLIKTLEKIVKEPKVIERFIENVKKTKVLYDNEEFDKILSIYQKLCK